MNGKALSAEHITFAYRINQVRPVLYDFTCAFEAGKINVLVGPNGCGKSTLLKLLVGVLTPSEGAVRSDERLITVCGEGAAETVRRPPSAIEAAIGSEGAAETVSRPPSATEAAVGGEGSAETVRRPPSATEAAIGGEGAAETNSKRTTASEARVSSRERAKMIGLLFQENTAPADLKVRDLVLEGRYPHLGFFAQPGADDRAKAEEAIRVCGLTALADRPLGSLSSGQRRLAWIAMAVAQNPRWLLLDEPTTYLDVARELDVLALVRRLNREFGMSVVMSIHDLNAAASVADRVYAMKDGKLVASGSPSEVLTPPILKSVFDADATVLADPLDGTPRIFWRQS